MVYITVLKQAMAAQPKILSFMDYFDYMKLKKVDAFLEDNAKIGTLIAALRGTVAILENHTLFPQIR